MDGHLVNWRRRLALHAAALSFFRLSRSVVTFACSVIIAATWTSVVGAVLTAEAADELGAR
jgi:hypothetical protein